jgi:hypothetical protein
MDYFDDASDFKATAYKWKQQNKQIFNVASTITNILVLLFSLN